MAATLPLDLDPVRPVNVWTADCVNEDTFWRIKAPWSIIGGWLTDETTFVAVSQITAIRYGEVR